MLKINENNFLEETATGLVLVDFYAEWCPPCRLIAPMLPLLKNVKVCKVDTDECHDLSAQFRISSIPCLVFMKDGVEVHREVGVRTQAVLQNKIDELNGG